MPYLATIEKQKLHDMLSLLPPGRACVARVLIGGEKARTYQEVADYLGYMLARCMSTSGGIRKHHPEVYQALMAYQQEQLYE